MKCIGAYSNGLALAARTLPDAIILLIASVRWRRARGLRLYNTTVVVVMALLAIYYLSKVFWSLTFTVELACRNEGSRGGDGVRLTVGSGVLCIFYKWMNTLCFELGRVSAVFGRWMQNEGKMLNLDLDFSTIETDEPLGRGGWSAETYTDKHIMRTMDNTARIIIRMHAQYPGGVGRTLGDHGRGWEPFRGVRSSVVLYCHRLLF